MQKGRADEKLWRKKRETRKEERREAVIANEKTRDQRRRHCPRAKSPSVLRLL